ncbi:unnamed protein product [marine sediment metagenome]|jgi:hypothetical protein|uniref:Uncharacterized protein n=1 Tax=marine sediment metagenome TaxID=412755 RepID=X0U8K0_9ZZZZ
MNDDTGFSQPIIEDPNSTVGSYPWDGDHGATRAFDVSSMSVMTNPMPAMVQPAKDAVSEEFQGLKEEVTESTSPEGADMGQTGDAGGDADGQNFGQDQGSQDTMEAESVTLPIIGTVSFLTIGVIGVLGYLYMKRGE